MISAIRKVFAGKRRVAEASAAVSPALVYAVGDVHGRADVLRALVTQLEADAAALGEAATLVLLGDLVDRGPESAEVLDQVLALRESGRWRAVETLKGNHEEAMLLFLEDASFGPTWMLHGGAATLASYGVAPPGARADETAWEGVRQALNAALPGAHLALLKDLKLFLAWGDYLFVHAGVRPGVPFEDQDPHDFLWIREDFLSSRRASDKVVVHGHTPSEAPELEPWRIGVDTGAYATGVLTAVRLKGAERRIFQARTARR